MTRPILAAALLALAADAIAQSPPIRALGWISLYAAKARQKAFRHLTP